jgi:hypothetical protein
MGFYLNLRQHDAMTTRPPIPEPPYAGGCLCGQARYTLAARPLALNACHCTDCKVSTGSSHIEMLIADAAAFHCTGETQSFIKTADSGRRLDIHRCTRCGTRLFHHNLANRALVFIPAPTLDESAWAIPTSHIYVERASPGVTIPGDAVTVEGQPADRAVLMAAFARVYGI